MKNSKLKHYFKLNLLSKQGCAIMTVYSKRTKNQSKDKAMQTTIGR